MFTPMFGGQRTRVYLDHTRGDEFIAYALPLTPPLDEVPVAQEAPPPTAWETFVQNVIDACSCCAGNRSCRPR